MPSWRPGCSIDVLRKRAELLQRVRSFFMERDVLEVDTPSISRCSSVDLHLDPLIVLTGADLPERFLVTSPEYHMKRLLCSGSGSIFQLCKAFRQEESGQKHNPEFTILEWYRVGWDHFQLMDDVDALMQEMLGCGSADRMDYPELFMQYAGLDPLSLTIETFQECCRQHRLSLPEYLLDAGASNDDRLDFLMGVLIEPQLGAERPLVVYNYPATQASLSRIHPGNPRLAERFEVFFKGMELGNGFHELANAEEQAKRFRKENRKREEVGKQAWELDSAFLNALEHGLPDCAGIAMGFDRLLMLSLGLESIEEVIPFAWGHS